MQKSPSTGQRTEQSQASPLDSLLEKAVPASAVVGRVHLATSAPAPGAGAGIVVGHLAGIDEDGALLVEFPGNPGQEPMRALAATSLGREHVGCPVALSFVEGNLRQPLILGVVHASARDEVAAPAQAVEIERDDKRLVISAEQELVLKCGESTITLTKAGKVLIRGKYLLSRSSGTNRIKGGSVQIN